MAQSGQKQTDTAYQPSEAELQDLVEKLQLTPNSNLMTVLQKMQTHFGYLPPRALELVSRRTRIPLSRIYSVVSFYAQFYTEPHAQHTIRVCRGTACHVKGASKIIEAVEQELDISEGDNTPDLMFYFETVACLGTCFLAPVMMIDDEYFGKLTPERVKTILRSYQDQQ